MEDVRIKIEQALDQVRPFLQKDGGDVELVEIGGDLTVKLRLLGACSSCDISHITMKAGIEESIRSAVPGVKEVVSV
jgi:Fe-S cluster biogenesis protein NfuA